MKIWIFGFALALVFCACQKEKKDKTPPVIDNLSVDAQSVEPNEVINVQVSLSDNSALSQVRVRISQAFAKSYSQWQEMTIRDISGTFYQGTFSFIVPDSATAGYYQIATQGSDMEGNGTIDSLIYFTVLQPGAGPQLIDFQTNPAMIGNTLYLTSNDSLSFTGLAKDNIGLNKVSIILQTSTEKSVKTLNYSIPDTISIWDFATKADTIYTDYDTYIPSQLIIKILDTDGNLTREVFPVEFTP